MRLITCDVNIDKVLEHGRCLKAVTATSDWKCTSIEGKRVLDRGDKVETLL
jgi:hypothetical protein